jgi:hypothetical protein
MMDAVGLLEASLKSLPPFDMKKNYTPKEREPFDALSDRFIRAVEVCLKFFRSYEKLFFAEYSETLRDLLNRMEKIELISSTRIWMDMRDVRNRVVHDYLPEEIQELYELMTGEFGEEILSLKSREKELRKSILSTKT